MTSDRSSKRSSRSNSTVSSVSVRSSSEVGDGGMERGAWGGKLEFILTCIGFAVGLGNVWRFPYLLYKSGGGAFLIPFVIMLFIIGIPLFFLELNFGQFASLGPLTIWNISPIMKGVGFAAVFTNLCVALYYNVIISWCLYYLFASMTDVLPWVDCDNYWNTPYCRTTAEFGNMTDNTTIIIDNKTITRMELKSPSEEYYYNKVLQMSDGVGESGTIIWQLALCLLLCWLIVFFVLIKGIGSLGKVVYVTSIFPYVLLTIMLIRGVTLEGAALGIEFYLIPDWSKLADPKVWSDAATQIFYALSTCTGGLIAMSSYNDFHNNTLRDSLIVPIVNVLTSFYAGFVIFSVLGYMATMKGVDVADVAADGPGLVFVVYPEGLATMPIAPLWSILFFIMMMMLGLSSMFSMVECVFSGFMDEYPGFLRKSYWHTVGFRAIGCICFYLISLPMVTNGGFYVFSLFDTYTGGFPLLFVGLLELVTICYIYGYSNYAEDVKMMLGKKPNIIFRIAWCAVSPLAVVMIIIFTAVYYNPPTLFSGAYVFPSWAEGIGWAIVAFCLLPLPLIFLYVMCKEGAYKIIYKTSQPNSLWHPAADKNRTGRYERVRHHKKEEVIDPDKIDMNANTWTESGHTELQTNQPQSIYATVSKGDKGIHVGDEHNGHIGAEHKDHLGAEHSSHVGAEHKDHLGAEHSSHVGAEHKDHLGAEHSSHVGAEHKDHLGAEHSSHVGAEHKGHVGAENKGYDHEGDRHSSDDGKHSTDGVHAAVEHNSDVDRSRSPSPDAHGVHYQTAAF